MESKKQTEMDKLVEEMMEHICDSLCRHPCQAEGQAELEDICLECRMGEFVCGILNKHNRYAGIVLCDDCEYRAYEKSTGIYWCRSTKGLDGTLGPGSGCPRGKRKEVLEEAGEATGQYADAPTLRPAT